jgi:hypothetical protein
MSIAFCMFLTFHADRARASSPVTTNFDNLTNWVQTCAPSENWNAVASSADGNKLVAVAYGGGIYTSGNAGRTWTLQTSAPVTNWVSAASSADGSRLMAVGGVFNNGGVWTSSDSGATWIQQTNAPWTNWSSVACSADGSNLVASSGSAISLGGIWTSRDAGVTWTQTQASSQYWYAVTSSTNGSALAAAVIEGGIWTSSDAGADWTEQTNAPTKEWLGIASSANGSNLVAAACSDGIFASTNSGVNWTQTTAPRETWESVASSADGSILVGVAWFDGVWISTNSGAAWIQTGATGFQEWYTSAISADGKRMAAAIYNNGLFANSGIWTAQAFVPVMGPPLSITTRNCPSNNCVEVSWPSEVGWNLYQNTNLLGFGTWALCLGVTNYAGSNYFNVLSPPGNVFFRLGQ